MGRRAPQQAPILQRRRQRRMCPICFPSRPPHRADYWARQQSLKILRPIDEIIASVFYTE